MKQQPAKGRTAKHTGTAKHSQATKKHHPTRHRKAPAQTSGKGKGAPPVAKHPQHHKPRQLALAGEVACCAAQALGTLLGWGWEDVLALYWRTASDPDSGASILDTLRAADSPVVVLDGAARVAGFRFLTPAECVALAGPLLLVPVPAQFAAAAAGQAPHLPLPPAHGLILGTDLPGPHALAVTPDGTWWSWGEPFSPAEWPDLTIEEAWSVRWPSWL